METFDERKSLEVISSMIRKTRDDIREDGFVYLFWGWLVLACALAHYFLLKYTGFAYPYWVWIIACPLGGIFTWFYTARQGRSSKVHTYIDEFMRYLWTAFGVTLFMTLLFMGYVGPDHIYPFVLLLYGLSTFVSGGVLRFKPLVYGGIACWVCAAGAIFVPFDIQLLLLGAAVILGYIIPGHMLRAGSKHETV